MSYLAYLNDLNKGKQISYLIDIKKNRPVRSTSANAYYRVILQHICAITGDTSDELHEFYKKKFNGKEVHDEVIGCTTTDMDSAEFTAYVNKVKEHAKSFFQIPFIPDPRDQSYAAWEQITKERYNLMFRSI